MAGNVWEWNDTMIGSVRVLRGGSWDNSEFYLPSSFRGYTSPSSQNGAFGFRVASVPEPSALILTLLFGTACVTCRKR